MTSEQSAHSHLEVGTKDYRKPYILRRQGVEKPDSWSIFRLEDLLELEYGESLPKKEREDGSYPVFGSNGRSGWHSEFHVESPGIIVGRKGVNLGIEWSDKDFNVIDTAYFVNEDSLKTPDINLRYLYYNLLDFDLDRLKSGSAVPGLNRDDFYEETIVLPPTEEQRKIETLLSNLDCKLKINNRVSELLEETAQAVFNHWFVDFGPYEEFKNSEAGEMPENFELKPLEDVLLFQRGYSYTGDELIDEESDKSIEQGNPMINLGNISPGGGYRPEKIKYCENVPKDRYLVEPGDLVISHTDMTQDQEILGSPVVVPDLEKDPMLFSHHLYAIKDSDLPKEYLYYYFLSPYFKPKAESFASGTTVLSFSSKITSDVHIPIPPTGELKNYLSIVKPMFEKREAIRKQNGKLSNLRETLLPKLMSGEIRVDDINLEDIEVDNEV